MGVTYKLKRFWYEASLVLVPDLCLLCSNKVWPGAPYCFPCIKAVRREEFMDWVPPSSIENGFLPTWSLTTFCGSIPGWIHGLKYKDFPSGFRYIGNQLAKRKLPNVFGKVDGLIPVPLHPLRKRERGFNQSERLAQVLGKTWDIPVNVPGLKRIQATETQTRLTQEERNRNISKAIVCGDANAIAGKHWVLVDDVMTTGSTLKACQAALLKAGAESVQAFVLAWVPREKPESKANRD